MKNSQNLTQCSLFTALIAVGAFIKIPIPVVPFTLQFLFTNLAGLDSGATPPSFHSWLFRRRFYRASDRLYDRNVLLLPDL